MREPELWSLVVQELQNEEEGNREQGNQAQSKHDKQAAEQQVPSFAPAVDTENKTNPAKRDHENPGEQDQ